MATWFQRQLLGSGRLPLFLIVLGLSMAVQSAETDEETLDSGLLPEYEQEPIKIADIDSENFEIGAFGGVLSIEDFESSAVVGGSLRYHVTEAFFAEARFGTATAGETSFERLSGNVQLLPEDERDVTFYDLSLGLNLFPGEAFFFRRAVNSGFYVVGGVGATSFAGNDELTINVGGGYQVIINDFMTIGFHIRDHMFESEVTGENKLTHNFEVSTGLSIFF
ncbi:MAG: outer membrane beta-barrel domain-containing protein [Pseudomonadota bacterium]